MLGLYEVINVSTGSPVDKPPHFPLYTFSMISAVTALKIKCRFQQNIEKELRVSISNIKPPFENFSLQGSPK